MCGIAGVWNFTGEPVDAQTLVNMTNRIAHRGPDDAAVYIFGDLGLGHRRLSIIDLSSAGRQPMCNEDGSLWVVFNGEIYNYRELVPELRAKGHQFRSQTDTEVILHAYEEWGQECLERFNGMWAFALWDSRKRTLFCARDRCGIKPFYYYLDGSRFVFGSEIKALLTHPEVPRSVNRQALYRYLKFQVKDDGDQTCFSNIQQLPPAHYMMIKAGRATTSRYWHPGATVEPADARLTDEEYAEQFFKLFHDSVRLRLRSDVPVGTCLSGGLDSSTIVSLVAGMRQDRLRTFSVTYPDTPHDEDRFVRDLIEWCKNLDPHVSTPDGRDVMEVMEHTVWHHDEPTWGPAVYSWWHVMRCARNGEVTVILNGQGADELLAGYPIYQMSFLRQLLLTGRMAKFLTEAKQYAEKNEMSLLGVLRLLAVPFWPESVRRLIRTTGAARSFDDSFLHADFRREVTGKETARDRKGFCSLQDHLTSDFCRTRLPELLHAEDRFSMAFSLESRVPFLDYRLIDFATSLPDHQKLGDSITKVVLRNAMAEKLPNSILHRFDKMGYPTPGNEWLCSIGHESVSDLLSARSLEEHGLFDPAVLRQRFERFARGEVPLRELWQWVSVEVWMQQFFDSSFNGGSALPLSTRTGGKKAVDPSVVYLGDGTQA